jgi:hypothetical protein
MGRRVPEWMVLPAQNQGRGVPWNQTTEVRQSLARTVRSQMVHQCLTQPARLNFDWPIPMTPTRGAQLRSNRAIPLDLTQVRLQSLGRELHLGLTQAVLLALH